MNACIGAALVRIWKTGGRQLLSRSRRREVGHHPHGPVFNWRNATGPGRPPDVAVQKEEPAPGIPEVIEKAGFGGSQVIIVLVACGTFFVEGLELLLFSLIARTIATEMQFVGIEGALPISSMVAGTVVGNLISGFMADGGGRQHPIMLAYGLAVIFSVWGSFMNYLFQLSLLTFFIGLGVGVGQPAALSLVREVMPGRWRFAGTASSSLFFSLGALLAVFMVTVNHSSGKESEWRLLLRCSAVPIMVLGSLSVFLLPESPSFLAANGDFALARDTLTSLQKMNRGGRAHRKIGMSSEGGGLAPRWQSSLRELFDPALRLRTSVVAVAAMVLHFSVYGSGYVIPRVLAKVAPTNALLIVLVLVAMLLVACIAWGPCFNPKVGLLACLVVSSAGALFTGAAAYADSTHQLVMGWRLRLELFVAIFGLCVGPTFGILFLAQISESLYPTHSNATNTAVCLAVGRMGAFMAPLISQGIEVYAGRWDPFFVCMAILQLGCFIMLLPLSLDRTGGEPAGEKSVSRVYGATAAP